MLHLTYLAGVAGGSWAGLRELLTSLAEAHGVCTTHLNKSSAMHSASKTRELLVQVFNQMYNESPTKDLDMVRDVLFAEGKRCVCEVLGTSDIDNNNILDKAVIYNNVPLANLLLDNTLVHIREDPTSYMVDTMHTACFLGCTEIASLFVKKFPDVVHLPGTPKFYPVAGPRGHRWEKYSIQHATYGHKLQRLHWMKTNPDKLPICYAIAGDHADIVKVILYSAPSYVHSLDLQCLLLSVACACASYKCLEVLSKVLPNGVNTRDENKKSMTPLGLSHGSTYVSVLLYCGLNKEILNDLDGDHTTNALHVFYHGLATDDKIYPKYRHLLKITKLLVENGVSVNQTTATYSRDDSGDTPLHLLLDQINLIITWNMGDYMPFEKWTKLQRYFDRAMLRAIDHILKSGFNIKKHGHSLIERLYANKNYLLRYKLSSDMDSLSHRQYGLGNVLTVTKLLFQNGAKQYCQRRTLTPLLSLIDGFHIVVSPFRTFQLEEFGTVFRGCIQELLSNGCDPNIHPLSRECNSQYASPLLHFLDLFSFNCCHEVRILTPSSMDEVCNIISLFIRHGANFTCHMAKNGKFIKHGVFDPLYPLLKVMMKACHKAHLNLGLASMRQLVLFLIHSGAQVEFCEYTSKSYHLTGPDDLKYFVIYHWLALGASSILVENGHSSLHATDNAEFLAVLHILVNQAEHHTFQSSTRAVVSYLECHEVDEKEISYNSYRKFHSLLTFLLQTPPSLQTVCRRTIYTTIQGDYSNRVQRLPLPEKLKQYLLLFQG